MVPMSIHRDACSAGLLNDPIICIAKSFFKSPARHLPARALQWQAGRSRSGEAGGSEGLSNPEPVEGERARDSYGFALWN
jgi:hypothetical protein